MKEPMIPRSLYDDLQIRFDDLQAKYHELVEEMLKRNPPPPQHVDIEYTDDVADNFPVPDDILTAIHTHSEPDSVEANTAQEAAFGMLRRGIDEESVIAAVHAGEDLHL